MPLEEAFDGSGHDRPEEAEDIKADAGKGLAAIRHGLHDAHH